MRETQKVRSVDTASAMGYWQTQASLCDRLHSRMIYT
jgi:hypothetical protein